MKRSTIALATTVIVAAFLSRFALTGSGGEPTASARKTGEKILDAASELFAALSEKEVSRALFEPGSEERINWHFIPRERKGLPIKDLDEGKRAKALALLKASLSEEGARKAEAVMAHEAILGDVEKKAGTTPFVRDPLMYFVSFFGKPTRDGKWGWRMEGHHLSLNFALSGSEVLSFTPAFYGANPAEVQEGPHKGLRLLAGVEDLGRALVASLGQEQLAACLTDADADVPKEVPGPGTARYEGPYPRGVTGKQLDEAQRKKLRDLIHEYIRNFPEDLAAVVSLTDLEGVHFAWRGGLKPLNGHSYLVHGPNFVLNYTDLQNGANHIHSCFRMLSGEFGRSQEKVKTARP